MALSAHTLCHAGCHESSCTPGDPASTGKPMGTTRFLPSLPRHPSWPPRLVAITSIQTHCRFSCDKDGSLWRPVSPLVPPRPHCRFTAKFLEAGVSVCRRRFFEFIWTQASFLPTTQLHQRGYCSDHRWLLPGLVLGPFLALILRDYRWNFDTQHHCLLLHSLFTGVPGVPGHTGPLVFLFSQLVGLPQPPLPVPPHVPEL